MIELCFILSEDRMKISPEENGELNQGQRKVCEYILENGGINATIISQHLQIPFDIINKQISTFVKKNLVERKSSKRTGGYWKVS